MKIHIRAMTGQQPAIEPHLLQDSQAQYALNCRFESGGIVPLKIPLLINSPAGAALKSIHKVGVSWFAFTAVVDLIMAPTYNSAERFYYTGAGSPRKSTRAAYAATGAYYNTGIPKPTTALTVNIQTNPAQEDEPGIQKEVSYTYCFVTGWGEVGPPADPTALVQVENDEYVTLTGMTYPTNYATLYNIVGLRVFRINRGNSAADYQELISPEWVADADTGGHIDDAVTTVKDQVGSNYELIDDGDLGDTIQSEDYTGPDSSATGITLLSNGVVACLVGNKVLLSDPYIPYGFPAANEVPTGEAGVAIAGYGTTLVVATSGRPWIIDCFDPSNKAAVRINEAYPAVNARGITSGKDFVAWVSTYGLIRVDAAGIQNLTDSAKLFTDTQWSALTPANMLLEYYNGRYYIFNYNAKTGFILDFSGQFASYIPFTLTNTILDTVVHNDGLYLLAVTDAGAFRIEQFDKGATVLAAQFKTKRFRIPPHNFSWGMIRGDFDTTVQFLLYGKKVSTAGSSTMTLLLNKTVSNQNAFKLPAGTKYDECEVWLVTSAAKTTEIVLADSIEELRA